MVDARVIQLKNESQSEYPDVRASRYSSLGGKINAIDDEKRDEGEDEVEVMKKSLRRQGMKEDEINNFIEGLFINDRELFSS